MACEWIPTVGTVVVALAGIAATLRTAAQGRKHAEHLATENHKHADQDRLRHERLKVYASALSHAVDQERHLDTVWASDGERSIKMSPDPPGGPLTLAARDEITVQMRLLADEEVEQAWQAFVAAWEALQWWAEVGSSGDPSEDAPEHLSQPLRAAIADLKAACRASLR